MNDNTLLIDADSIIYNTLLHCQKEIQWEDDIYSLSIDLGEARDEFLERLHGLLVQVGHAAYHLCLTDTVNFRHTVDPTYKGNRKDTRKPMGYKVFRGWVMETFPCVLKPNLEADDVVGILATHPNITNPIIWSPDKDLMQIAGKHLVDGKIIEVTKNEGFNFHMYQTLVGDVSDGYKGCPSVGAVGAKRIIDDAWMKTRIGTSSIYEHVWNCVVNAYIKAGLTEQDALQQARLAKILQYELWDNSTQEVILWKPVI